MTRLPKPGGDAGEWSEILNDFLLVAHNPDGTPREASKTTTEINVRDYGAKGDGVTDDTAAIQAAIDAAGSGLVVFPSGVFMVRGLKIHNKGAALRGDGRWATRIVRHSGTAPLIDISGSSTHIGHQRYNTISNFMLSGNNMPGLLLRSYYADSCVYREVAFIHCKGVAVDFVEVWDTHFENCLWEDCGSLDQPATLFRNSTARGTFGFSEDNTNQIYFYGCRWEDFRNGAVRLDGGANGSKELLNGIFFVSCKMETPFAAGPAFQILSKTTVIFVNQLYVAIMGRDPDHHAPIDAIEDHASHSFMTNVYVQWGPVAGLANSVAHIVDGAPHMYHGLGTFYPTENPVKATVIVEPAAADVTMSSLWVNRGKDGIGIFSRLLNNSPLNGVTIPLIHPGAFRVTDYTSGKDRIKIDNNPNRPALHAVNATDVVGFSDEYVTERWRIIGASGAARFASGKFQIEFTKGYIGVGATPVAHIAMLVEAAGEGDRGLVIVRPSGTATNRLVEFQDEAHNLQGMAIDSHGRPIAVGTPPRVTPGAQVSYANPGIQVRDIAGNIVAAVKPSPTAPGTIVSVTFSRQYAAVPLSITLTDNSPIASNLYISARSASGFTVSTRSALGGGSMLNFDYTVIA